MKPISGELVAAKLHAIKNCECDEPFGISRFAEILWWLQEWSWSPGGLPALSKTLVSEYPEQVGAGVFWEFGRKWTPDQCVTVWEKVKKWYEVRSWFPDFADWASLNVGGAMAPDILKAGCIHYNFDYFNRKSRLLACDELSGLFYELCVHKVDSDEPHHFRGLFQTLMQFMDKEAAKARAALGDTKVVGLVFKRLNFSLQQNYPVLIVGESRAGKTKSVETWCKMRPGLARLVTVPDVDREWEFLAAHADALRIEYTDKCGLRKLDREIEYTLRHSGLYLVYDESHYLIPTRYTKKTVPRRLNWVRARVIDRGIGAAFFATRQSYHQAMDKFVSTTKYHITQWVGRIAEELVLPDAPDKNDMIIAAKARFPSISGALIKLIVAECRKRGTDFQQFESIIRYSLFVASQNGRATIELSDVETAFADLYKRPEMSAMARREAVAAPAQTAGDAFAPAPQDAIERTISSIRSANIVELSPGRENPLVTA